MNSKAIDVSDEHCIDNSIQHQARPICAVCSKGKGLLTCTGFPARSAIHCFASGHVLFNASRPAFPRLLISWSGFATSFALLTHWGIWLSGVIVFVFSSHEI